MQGLEQYFNMILGSVVAGPVAWLSTTFMIMVMMPGILGVFLGAFGANVHSLDIGHLFETWFKYCVAKPASMIGNLILAILKAPFPKKKKKKKHKHP